MGRPAAWWAGFWIGFGLLDWWADRRGKSLCAAVRWLFRTDTRVGGALFTGVFTGGAVVLHQHVKKKASSV